MPSTRSGAGWAVGGGRPGRIRRVHGDGLRRGACVVTASVVLGPDDFDTITEAPDAGRLEGGQCRRGKNKRA
jgi:hypothetical protein